MKYAVIGVMVLSAMTVCVTSNADALGWRASHPRRAEVNARLNNQDRRINRERREGEITASQAHDLHAEDRGIRAEERFDASNNGSHITRSEDATLNHQENQVSRQIGH